MGWKDRNTYKNSESSLKFKLVKKRDENLDMIRKNLFYGLSNYRIAFPDLLPYNLGNIRKDQEYLENIKEDFFSKLRNSLKTEKEILMYIHLPFCHLECTFCDTFPNIVNQKIQERYLSSLLQEIEIFSKFGIFKGKKIKGLYFGGGTPTTYSNNSFKRIIDKIESYLDFSQNCNITSEAHPLTLINKKRIKGLADLGINRISLGCETFDPDILKLCNRFNPPQMKEIVKNIKSLGLLTNIDLMIGLPGQTITTVKNDLKMIEKVSPDSIEYMKHDIVNPLVISLYKKNPNLMVEDDKLFEMRYLTQNWMEEHGYKHIQFYSQECWPYRFHWLSEMPYLAFGPSTRSYTKHFYYVQSELSLYSREIDKGNVPIAYCRSLTKVEEMYRSLFLNIQTKYGLNLKEFKSRFSKNALEVFYPLIKRLMEFGCVKIDESSIRLTKYGKYFLEDVCLFIQDFVFKPKNGI